MEGEHMFVGGNQDDPKFPRPSQPMHQGEVAKEVASRGSAKEMSGDESERNAIVRGEEQQQQSERGFLQNGQLVGVKDGWVVYALHPTRGRFVVNEGVVLVGDQQIVCGGARQGFFATHVPEETRGHIYMNDSLLIPVDAVIFPNLFMLSPEIWKMAVDVVEIARAGVGEVTHPQEVPFDEPLPAPGARAFFSPRGEDMVHESQKELVSDTSNPAEKATSTSGDAGIV